MFPWPRTLDASPVFSINQLTATSSGRNRFIAEFISHLRLHGFARIRNSGVAPESIKELFRQHRNFFNLPLPAKLTVRHPGGVAPARGYSPWAYEKTAVLRPDLHAAPGVDTLISSPSHQIEFSARSFGLIGSSKTQLLDAREQFAIGPPGDSSFPTPQLAESLLPGFNAATRDIYHEIAKTCSKLVLAIELGLGVPLGTFDSLATGELGAELNLNFYPEVEHNVLNDNNGSDVAMRRIWPHSDLGIISALFQDGVGASGLELEVRGPREGNCEFAPVPIEQEGDVLLLVSDTLERWTNGDLRAALHRVGLPPGSTTSRVPERRSAVMFFRALPTADIGPKPHFISTENPARYDHITAGDYLKRHNKRLY
ncbi:Clavaminate synthase-like protein [Daldinia eschscholtzii]|nr:Clavaminate synthase-like protein [Daldinia eschscholtzii]